MILVADPGDSAKLVHQVNDMLVAAQTGARVVGTLADDPAGAEQLAGRRRGRLDKSLLIRSARKVTADLYQQYGAAWAVPADGAPVAPGAPAPDGSTAPHGPVGPHGQPAAGAGR